jgi:hypothetical protein
MPIILEKVLAPVPHRQYVCTVPKLLRPCFHQRHSLGEFYRIVGRQNCATVKEIAHTRRVAPFQALGGRITGDCGWFRAGQVVADRRGALFRGR